MPAPMPSLLGHAAAWLAAPGNQLAYAVRSTLRWRRGKVALPTEPMDSLLDHLPAAARADAVQRVRGLEQEFDLAALARQATRLVYAENLALIDRLEALRRAAGFEVGGSGAQPLAAVDVGCGVFQYAAGLQRWLRFAGTGAPREVVLLGVEIDGFGIYRDGSSRADHAAAHAALAGPGTRFQVADIRRLVLPPQDVVTMLFPFLSAYPLLRWGAPLHHLRPRAVLAAAVGALRPGGLLVVVNQTAAEGERLRALLAGQPVRCLGAVPFASELVPYAERTADRVGSCWLRC